MKNPNLKLSALIFLFFSISTYSQNHNNDSLTIKLGVKVSLNNETNSQIQNGTYNNVDALDYEVIKLLKNKIEKQTNYNVRLIEIGQNNKLSQLKDGTIDALLYTFSETDDRKKKGIHFSNSYYQNDGVGIIVNNQDINVKLFGEKLIRIGCVDSTRPFDHLQIIKQSYINNSLKEDTNLVIKPFKDHQELLDKLKAKEIDAIAGDVSRLFYETANGQFSFGGFLPIGQSQIKDNYGIGITPNKEYLKTVFDDFLIENDPQIKNLQEKWIGTISRNFYANYENRKQDKYVKYFKYILITNVILFIAFVLYANNFLKKKREELKNKDLTIKNITEGQIDKQNLKNIDKVNTEVNKITASLLRKTKNKLSAKDVAEEGINMFRTAQESIIYVGSGGFLSDPNYGNEWLSSLHECLVRKRERNFNFTRVVDLPEMDKNQLKFSESKYFNPPPQGDYVKKYFKWLILQYANLKTYSNVKTNINPNDNTKTNLKIINSRGAALWSFGIVMIIKDQSDVLIFTTSKNSKFGMHIPSPDLSESIHILISAIIDIGKPMEMADIEKTFFLNDEKSYKLGGLNDIIDKINSLEKGDMITNEIIEMIDNLCKSIKI